MSCAGHPRRTPVARICQKLNVGAVFLLRAENGVLRFSSLRFSKVITNGLTSNSSKNGCGSALSNCVRLGRHHSRGFSTRNPVYGRRKRVKRADSF
jgi:hypothetical protein